MTENVNVPYGLFSVWQMIGGLLVAVVVPILRKYRKRDLTVEQTEDKIADEPDAMSNLTDLTPMESQPLKETLEKVDESVA